MDSTVKMRHCAFCLIVIEDQSIKLCGKCRRRSYCSRECQIADWSPEGKGQGHKNWCHLTCGEEDIDWVVRTVPDKGLGIVAKRLLPATYRIIVDSCHFENDHPAIKDLMPNNGSFQDKFDLNCIDRGDESAALCLRISRVNHNCNSNADHWYDETFKVVVLFAQREIEEGEEITINYQLSNDISRQVSAEASRFILQKKWNIICPLNCICYDKSLQDLITKSREIDGKIMGLASRGRSIQALNLVNELLSNYKRLNSCLLNKRRTLYDGFQVAIMRKKTLNAAKPFIEELYAIQSAIMSPESLAVKETERYMKNIQSHRNYLILG